MEQELTKHLSLKPGAGFNAMDLVVGSAQLKHLDWRFLLSLIARGSDLRPQLAPLGELVTAQSIVVRGLLVGFTAEAARTPKA